jgi:hypothetical protein
VNGHRRVKPLDPLDARVVARLKQLGFDTRELEASTIVLRREERARQAGEPPTLIRNFGTITGVR